MTDMEDEIVASHFGRWLRTTGLSLAVFALIGVAVGFLIAHNEHGGEFGLYPTAFLVGVALLLAGCIWLLVRNVSKPTGEEPLTAKERLNRNIIMGSGALGGVMGMLVVLAVWASGEEIEPFVAFSNSPLPTGVAVVLVLVIGVIIPVLSFVWHRSAVDEQEEDAYKTGALYGMYVFMIGAPVWWFAWRGGFAPEPNGVIIYFATIVTLGAIWLWKKYR